MRRLGVRLRSSVSLASGWTPLQSMSAAQVPKMQRNSASERVVRVLGRSQARIVSPRYWGDKRRSTQ
eukprot:11174856-Lingulodinium_polyedra.AAC.1